MAALSLAITLSSLSVGQAHAACGPNALGTSRTIEIDASKHRSFKGKEAALGLRHKEVILTFDDGPIAGKTPRILKALKKECVKATFFYVGKMARAYPKLVRRVVADGHTLAHHTHNHNALPKYSTAKASALIDQGVSRLQKIAYGDSSSTPRTPFFRYPYLARNKRTDRMLARKGLIAFGANIDALDWKRVSPSKVHNRIMRLVRKEGKGIILMHDIQNRTAKMLPRLLRTLKSEGYKVVHMVAKGSPIPKEDPIVVAAVDTSKFDETRKKKALKNKREDNTETNTAYGEGSLSGDIIAQADAEIEAARAQTRERLTILGDNNLVRTASVTGQPTERSLGNTARSGVKLVSAPRSEKTPEAVAKAFNAQLKRTKTQSKNKRVRRTLKRKAKSQKRKKNFIVLAGNRRSKTINAGGWKLRRSQWILR